VEAAELSAASFFMAEGLWSWGLDTNGRHHRHGFDWSPWAFQEDFSSPMNPLLHQLVETGRTETASGMGLPMHARIPPMEDAFWQAIPCDLPDLAVDSSGWRFSAPV
jgi:hypothetical protein